MARSRTKKRPKKRAVPRRAEQAQEPERPPGLFWAREQLAVALAFLRQPIPRAEEAMHYIRSADMLIEATGNGIEQCFKELGLVEE